MSSRRWFIGSLLTSCAFCCACVAYAQESPKWVAVYEGVDVAMYAVEQPLQKIFAARIDLKAPGIEFQATPANKDFKPEERETWRQTTADFLKEQGLSVAVNANFYNPFGSKTIGTPGDSNLLGLGVADGFVESAPQPNYPSFVVKKDGSVDIRQYEASDDLSDVQQAVSGNKIVLKDGEIVETGDKSVHPRTAVGYSKDRRYVYLMTIDGRQKGYSVGATYADVAKALQYFGAYDGLNLDGGGSTTFVVRDAENAPVVLNSPCNSTKDHLRHNANAIGVRANGAPKVDVSSSFKF